MHVGKHSPGISEIILQLRTGIKTIGVPIVTISTLKQ